MGDAQKYTVVMSGEIGPGCDINKAKAEFAELFKTTIEKSEPYFQGKRRVLRKDLGQKQAEAYEEALSKIGIISDLLPQQVEEVIPKTSVELSVVDREPKHAPELSVAEPEPKKVPDLSVVNMTSDNQGPGIQVEKTDTPQTNSSMICPKCRTHQQRAVACAQCGVIIEKYRKIASTAADIPSKSMNETTEQITVDVADNRNTRIIAGAAAVLISITVIIVMLL